MKTITCPRCGAVGFDDHSLPAARRAEAVFKRSGNLRGMPIYKCVVCGSGLRMTRLIRAKYEVIPSPQWTEIESIRADERADFDRRFENVQAFQAAKAADPSLSLDEFLRAREGDQRAEAQAPKAAADDSARGRTLGSGLFRSDPRGYHATATAIVVDRERRPRMSRSTEGIVVAKFIRPLLLYFDGQSPDGDLQMTPFLHGLTQVLGEALAGAYALATSETWESLDRTTFANLVDGALGYEAAQNPARAFVSALRGVSSDLPAFEALNAYLRGRPTYQRLSVYSETQAITPGKDLAEHIRVNKTDREKVSLAVSMGWRAGVVIAVLETLTLVPLNWTEGLDSRPL